MYVCMYKCIYIQYIQGLCQSRLSTENHALLLIAPATTAVSNSSGELLPFYNLARTEYRTLNPTVRVFVCCDLRIRCHGNSYRSRSNQSA
jgi:hypothetical protein